ncbi:MAG: LysR family transcriptional regulator, partial [Halomonadaceae bacterium]
TRQKQPLNAEQIAPYSAIVAADTSRQLRPGNAGIFSRQRTLTVSNITQKISAQIAGLGVGWLPTHQIQDALASGRLVRLQVSPPRSPVTLCMARWENHGGKAAEWFWQHCSTPGYFAQWLDPLRSDV